MRRARLSGALIGVVVLLLNLAIVIAVVVGLEGLPALPSSSTTSTQSSSTHTSSSSSTTREPESPAQVIASRSEPVVVVLGAEAGVGAGGWVDQLAPVLADRSRKVRYAALEPEDPTRYAEELVIGEGEELTLRNGSVADADLTYAAERVEFLVPKGANVVLISMEPRGSKDVKGKLDALVSAVDRRAPDAAVGLVLTPRPAADTNGPVRRAQRDWARDAGVPVIDVDGAFRESPRPDLRADWLPSGIAEAGADLWARTVADVLLEDTSQSTSQTAATTSSQEATTAPTAAATEPAAPDPRTTSAPTYSPPESAPPSPYVPPTTYVPPRYVPPPTYDPPSTSDPTATQNTSSPPAPDPDPPPVSTSDSPTPTSTDSLSAPVDTDL